MEEIKSQGMTPELRNLLELKMMKFTKDRIIHEGRLLFNKVVDFFEFYFGDPIIKIIGFFLYDLPSGTRNLISWFPLIWHDRNWDDFYLMEMIKFKLERMVYHFENYGHLENGMKYARQMRACVKLIEKTQKDDYGYLKKHDEKWGKTQLGFEPFYNEKTGEMNSACLMTTYRANVKNQTMHEMERVEFRQACEKEEIKASNMRKAVFRIMGKNSRYWWD